MEVQIYIAFGADMNRKASIGHHGRLGHGDIPLSILLAHTPPVAEAAVSSTALSNAANSVSGYTVGTLGAMMHDCVKWVFTGRQALKQAQDWQSAVFCAYLQSAAVYGEACAYLQS